MKKLALIALALCWEACVGTLEDPATFSIGSGEVRENDASSNADGDVAKPDASTWMDASGAADAAADRERPTVSAPDAEAAAPKDAALADAAGPVDAGPSCNFKALMQTRCGSASCHGNGGAAAGLDLTSDGLAARVAGRRASGACSDGLLIDPAQPAQSVLYRRVADAECGVRMPLGGTLRSDEQACVLRWIEGL